MHKDLGFTSIADTEEVDRGLILYLISNLKQQRVNFPINNDVNR